MATTKEATPNSNAAVRDLDWMLVMGSLLCAKSAPTTSAPFSAPRLCASTRKVSHNEKLESDAFQAARDYHPGPGSCLLTASEQYDVVSHRRRFLPLPWPLFGAAFCLWPSLACPHRVTQVSMGTMVCFLANASINP